jgi:hypothetical protein
LRKPLDASLEPVDTGARRMTTKTIRILSFLGKTAGLVLTVAGPFSGTPIGLTVFAVSSFLKDAVNRIGDLADDGKPNDSFKT